MKLFLCERVDRENIEYDQYTGFVVSAESEGEVRDIIEKLMNKSYFQYGDITEADFKVTQIGLSEKHKGIVLEQFNAG